ncbi:MAG TPA: dienelactone hydrolase family protein [Chloroflexota bacterium]|nr:dienelactone hydrolase family protein [Chloroflexota bacterium]
MDPVESNGLRARVVGADKARRPGVLVLPAWPGIDERVEQCCGWLADEGFMALAWDPFSAYEPDLPLEERRRLTRSVLQDTDARLEQMHWIGYIRQELGIDHVGGIGFCMGGRQGLLLGALDQRLACFSAFYPTVRMPVPQGALNAVDAAPEVHCPVQVHYPGLDEATKYETFVALRSALETRPGSLATLAHYYPDAEHGFLAGEYHERAGNAAATALAWPLTIAFLRSCLRGAA